MSATLRDDRRAIALFGKTRRAVLSLIYSRPGEVFYLRQIARATGSGQGAIQSELKRLSDAGIILRMLCGKHVLYRANKECPIYKELKGLITKTAGVVSQLRVALSFSDGYVDVAFIYTSPDHDEKYGANEVDVVVVGDGHNESVLWQAGETLDRIINVKAYTPDEYRSELAKPRSFLNWVLTQKKQFVIGNERSLAKLREKTK
ncbi:MAG: winged helix-turn-helix transcriptional regulator [Chloroflexi bacterium]|nr:winged helix-turn-helix transcriptional regulator [Chloroflexota bacterium]